MSIWKRRGVWLALFALGVALVPHRLCAHEAGDWFSGDAATQTALARSLEETIARPLSRHDFPTGSKVLDGEWLFGTYMMAAMGFGQLALEHPETRAHQLAKLHDCIAKMIAPSVRSFDTEAWDGDDALATLDGDADHGSYLGYLNLALSLDRLLEPKSEYARLNDRVTAALARRLERAPSLLLESYPGMIFPVDNTAVIGSIALHDRALGSDAHRALVTRFCAALDQHWRDRRTGLLRQTMPGGAARGSGTALAAYFLGFADRRLSAELLAAMKRELYAAPLGFGAMREYPRGRSGGGDADSGPLVLGFGVSATGFALGAARMNGDATLFARLYATVALFGVPVRRGGARHFATGGPIGNAILFAMLTAPAGRP
jgi:hypothetical protein